jgi:hypothetical protein
MNIFSGIEYIVYMEKIFVELWFISVMIAYIYELTVQIQ